MKLLLDTHAMLWWWGFPARLSDVAREDMASPEHAVYVSPVSAFEITLKHRLGKLTLPPDLLHGFPDHVREERWKPLPLEMPHALLAGRLATDHRDPFDRLLAAQAISENLRLVTADRALTAMGDLRVIW